MSDQFYIIGEIIAGIGIILCIVFPIYLKRILKNKYGDLGFEKFIILELKESESSSEFYIVDIKKSPAKIIERPREQKSKVYHYSTKKEKFPIEPCFV